MGSTYVPTIMGIDNDNCTTICSFGHVQVVNGKEIAVFHEKVPMAGMGPGQTAPSAWDSERLFGLFGLFGGPVCVLFGMFGGGVCGLFGLLNLVSLG